MAYDRDQGEAMMCQGLLAISCPDNDHDNDEDALSKPLVSKCNPDVLVGVAANGQSHASGFAPNACWMFWNMPIS